MAKRIIPTLSITPEDVVNGYFVDDLTDDPGEGKFVDAQTVRDFVGESLDGIVTHSLGLDGTPLYAINEEDEQVPLDDLIVTDNDGNIVWS